MGVMRCRNCDNPVTRDEVKKGVCPACGEFLGRMDDPVMSPASGGSVHAPRQSGISLALMWIDRIAVAGMLFSVAGCITGFFIYLILTGVGVPDDTARLISHLLSVLAYPAFFLCLVLWIVSKGVGVLVGRND